AGVDASWDFYLTNLHPGAALQPLLLSWSQLELRREHGDQLDVPRDVNHALSFKSEKGRTDFLDFVRGDGWKSRTFDVDSDSADLGCRFGVELTKSHELT